MWEKMTSQKKKRGKKITSQKEKNAGENDVIEQKRGKNDFTSYDVTSGHVTDVTSGSSSSLLLKYDFVRAHILLAYFTRRTVHTSLEGQCILHLTDSACFTRRTMHTSLDRQYILH